MRKDLTHTIELEIQSVSNEHVSHPEKIVLKFSEADIETLKMLKRFVDDQRKRDIDILFPFYGRCDNDEEEYREASPEIKIMRGGLYYRSNSKYDCWDIIESERFSIADIMLGFVIKEIET